MKKLNRFFEIALFSKFLALDRKKIWSFSRSYLPRRNYAPRSNTIFACFLTETSYWNLSIRPRLFRPSIIPFSIQGSTLQLHSQLRSLTKNIYFQKNFSLFKTSSSVRLQSADFPLTWYFLGITVFR